MRQYDGVRVRVKHLHQRIRLDEALDLVQDEAPLDLVVGLVGAGVVGDVPVQLDDQLPHQLHASQ